MSKYAKELFRQQKQFSIRKLSVGVFSVLIGVSFILHSETTVLANESSELAVDSVVVQEKENATYDTVESGTSASDLIENNTETSFVSEEMKAITEHSIQENNLSIPSESSQIEDESKEEQPYQNRSQDSQEEIELITNGEFIEQKTPAAREKWTGPAAQDWSSTWVPIGEEGSYTIAVEDGALVLSSNQEFRTAVTQSVEIDPSLVYTLSFDVKTQDLVSEQGARVRIVSRDDTGKQLALWYSTGIHQASDWQTISETIGLPKEAKTINVELFFEKGIGTIFYDNISLKAQPVVSSEVVEQPLETDMVLPTNKRHLLRHPDYQYVVDDTSVASVQGGILLPLAAGRTLVHILEGDKEVSSFALTVEDHLPTTFDDLRQSWDDMMVGNRFYDDNNPLMRQLREKSEQTVTSNLEKLHLDAGDRYLFEDITDYNRSANITTTYRRLEQMAHIAMNPSSIYYQNEDLIRKVRFGVEWMYSHIYNLDKEIVGNWWDWEIGGPRALDNILVHLYPYFSQEEINRYTDPIKKFVPDPMMIRMTTSPVPAVGGNQTDIGKVTIVTSVLRKENEELKAGIEGLATVLELVTSGQGFYHDGSYIDHTNVAYTGAYGSVLIDGLSQLLPLVQRSEFAISKDKLDIVYTWIDKGFAPLLYKGGLMDMSRGRSVSRSGLESHAAAVEVLRGILRIAEASEKSEQVRLQQLVKTIVEQDTFYDIYQRLYSYMDIELVSRVLENDAIEPLHRASYLSIFNNMDKVAYYNAEHDFGIAISMFSKDTQNYEFMNQENKKGWYTADGMVYLYNGDLSHYSNGFWPTVNQHRHVGTTVSKNERVDGSGQTTLRSQFVGGVTLDDTTATIAMDFNNWEERLLARKGWFILDDKIVFLGADILHNYDKPVETIIENRKLQAGKDYRLFVNGQEKTLQDNQETRMTNVETLFLQAEETNQSIAYRFSEPTDIYVLKERRTASWKDINQSQSDQSIENTFLTIWQEHEQTGGSYAYTLLPNQERLSFLEGQSTIDVLENNENLQAIYDTATQTFGIIKYDDEKYLVDGSLLLQTKGLYSIRKQEQGYELAYYNPLTDNQVADIKDLVTLPSDYELVILKKPSLSNQTLRVSLLPMSYQVGSGVYQNEAGMVELTDPTAKYRHGDSLIQNDELNQEIYSLGSTKSLIKEASFSTLTGLGEEVQTLELANDVSEEQTKTTHDSSVNREKVEKVLSPQVREVSSPVSKKVGEGATLPSTGEERSSLFLASAALAVVASVGLLDKKKKKRVNG